MIDVLFVCVHMLEVKQKSKLGLKIIILLFLIVLGLIHYLANKNVQKARDSVSKGVKQLTG